MPFELDALLLQLLPLERGWLRRISITLFSICDCCGRHETIKNKGWLNNLQDLPTTLTTVFLELGRGKDGHMKMSRKHRVIPEKDKAKTHNHRSIGTAVGNIRPDKIIVDGVALVEILNKQIRRQSPGTATRMTGAHFAELSPEEQDLFTGVLADFQT